MRKRPSRRDFIVGATALPLVACSSKAPSSSSAEGSGKPADGDPEAAALTRRLRDHRVPAETGMATTFHPVVTQPRR